MGKMITYLTILICIDLLFVMTGQICNGQNGCSLTSAIFGFAINPSPDIFSVWFKTIIGDVNSMLNGEASSGALGNLFANLATAGIAVGALLFGLKNEAYLWMGTGLSLSLLSADFIIMFSYFYSFNPIVAVLLFSPIIVIFIFTCLEWVRGKD